LKDQKSKSAPSVQNAVFRAKGPLMGTINVPGDKSISHRAIILSSLAVGKSRITGLLEGEDVLATVDAMRAMGAMLDRSDSGIWTVHGVGVGGLMQPDRVLDMGNSGTSTRLLMGLVASHGINATFSGDASLSNRPMGRVIDPLRSMGATIQARKVTTGKFCLPLTMTGMSPAVPIEYVLPVASAQVKSAILLAGLNTPGTTKVVETIATRDHSENMLAGFGADIKVDHDSDGNRVISITGEQELSAQKLTVPGDPSSAAFPIVAALIVPGSDITVKNVGINPTRAGLFEILQMMGADIVLKNKKTVGGEPVADIRVRHSVLTAIDVPPTIAPSMIDEFPILFIAAAMAEGTTTTSGLHELRIKESDRLHQMAEGLSLLGVDVEQQEDGLIITGTGGKMAQGGANKAIIETALDHRIAMSFAVAGLTTKKGVTVDDMSPVETSFPGFAEMIDSLAGKDVG